MSAITIVGNGGGGIIIIVLCWLMCLSKVHGDIEALTVKHKYKHPNIPYDDHERKR